MSQTSRLTALIAQSSILVTAMYFVLAFALARVKQPSSLVQFSGASLLLVPAEFAAWWIYRGLQRDHSTRESRAVGITLAITAPITLVAALLVGQLFGGYADQIGHIHFELLSVTVGFVVALFLANIVLVLMALWITRRTVEAEDSQQESRPS